MEKLIEDSNLLRLFVLVRKGYRLALLKYCAEYLSQEDLSKSLEFVWTSSEDPNQDPNCSVSYLIKLFRACLVSF